jgi:hypothetical protein
MANLLHLLRLKRGVKFWNRWRKENPDVRPNLRKADLSGADLRGADLREANLRQANLRQANLRQADLRRANLRGTDLSGATLSGATLSEATLSGATLSGATLRGTDLSLANLRWADLSRVDLREADLRGTDLSDAILTGARLLGATLSRARLSRVDLRETDLSETDLSETDLSGATLSGARFRTANHWPSHPDLWGSGRDYVRGDKVIAIRSSKVTLAAVDFTVFYPMTIFPERWYKLLAYVHLPSALGFVLTDSRTQLGTQARDFATDRDRAAQLIKHGAEIVIVPELPGCRFNPTRTSLLWLEDWHRAEFRIQAEPDLPGFELDMLTTGRVTFYVGPILISEVPIAAYISREARHTDPERPDAYETAKPYQSVFVSYSHKDTAIVDQLERAYTVLGIQYLRDVRILRSGEKWNPALLGKIEEADIFQLCWSYTAKGSNYVEQEWRHALSLDRFYFIRPVYWEKPMPEPPSELSDIHFAYLELEHEDRAA